MTLLINPTYEPLRSWIEALPRTFDEQGTIIYDARNRIRVMEGPDGRLYNVKRFCRPIFINRIAYTFLRQPKAVRAYYNALRLQKLGIPTPEPVAYIVLSSQGLVDQSYLLTVQVPQQHMLYEFGQHTVEGYEDFVRQLARFTAMLHEKGVLHKDYSPGNILFDVNEAGQAAFCLVDINRMKFFPHPLDFSASCRNFERLWGGDDFFALLGREYALARGWDEQQTIAKMMTYRDRFRKKK